MFYPGCFYLSPRVLRGPSADRRETVPHDLKLAEFCNASPKIWGRLPKNGQSMQNFGRFYTTCDFDREYLRNDSKYAKAEN